MLTTLTATLLITGASDGTPCSCEKADTGIPEKAGSGDASNPLTGSDLRTHLQPAAIAAVFIAVPPDPQDGADAAAGAFGLTQTETRVVASLFAGRTLAETGADLGIARTT